MAFLINPYVFSADDGVITDDLTTDNGWTSNTSDWSYNATGDYLDFNPIRRNTTAQIMYLDMQNSNYLGSGNYLDASALIVRLGKFNVQSIGGSTGNVQMFFGVSNNTSDDDTTQQTVYHDANGNPNDNNLAQYVTTGNQQGTGSSFSFFSPKQYVTASTDYWLEMIRDDDDFTFNFYPDADYDTADATASITKSGVSNLRYIKFTNDSASTKSVTWVAPIYGDIVIYDGVTTPP